MQSDVAVRQEASWESAKPHCSATAPDVVGTRVFLLYLAALALVGYREKVFHDVVYGGSKHTIDNISATLHIYASIQTKEGPQRGVLPLCPPFEPVLEEPKRLCL